MIIEPVEGDCTDYALDMGSDLPEGERKRFAAKAVQDIMREL